MDIIELRHKLHRIPELAFQEFKTKALLEKSIREILESNIQSIFGIYIIFKIVRFTFRIYYYQ